MTVDNYEGLESVYGRLTGVLFGRGAGDKNLRWMMEIVRLSKKNHMAQELSEKHQIIDSFLAVNGIEKSNQVIEFMSIVEFVELSICDVTKVHMLLDNYYFGNIELYETKKIDIDRVHTGFSVSFVEYQLDNQTLVIKGTASPAKGGKDYTVKITPID